MLVRKMFFSRTYVDPKGISTSIAASDSPGYSTVTDSQNSSGVVDVSVNTRDDLPSRAKIIM